MRRESGLIGGLLLVAIFLIVAAGIAWYWYPEKRSSLQSLWGEKKEDRGYITYDEHLATEEREKKLADFKKKVSSWFENKK